MRIVSLEVKGYRSLRNISWGAASPKDAQLRQRNVVFGPNAAGKSNLLRVLDLLLVRAPRLARERQLDLILISDEPVALHVAQDPRQPATVTIILDQDLSEVTSVLERSRGIGPGEGLVAEQLLAALGDATRAQVEIEYTIQVYDVEGTIAVTVKRIIVGGGEWFRDGRIIVQDEREAKQSSTQRRGASAGQRPKSTEPTGQPVEAAFDADLLRALAHGFVRIDCPRVLQTGEPRITPKFDLTRRDALRQFQPSRVWWSDIPEDLLANRLNAADRDPYLAERLDQFREHLRREHGRIGIQTSWRLSSAELPPQEYLELILTQLVEFYGHSGSTQYLPARFRGTGFVQMLHILASCYLSGASVIGIEELEVNLAPATQLELWQWLGDQVGPGGPLEQVLVTSHSPVFILRGKAGDGTEEAEPGIYYAELDGLEGTYLRRLEKDGGKDAGTQEVLVRHFGFVDESLWKLAAALWSQSPKKEKNDTFEGLYVGDEQKHRVFDVKAFRKALADTRDAPDTKLSIVKSVRVRSKQPSPLKRALSLNEWISDTVEPRQLHVEWTEAGTWDAERRVRVQGAPMETEGDTTNELVLYVEEKLRREQIDEKQAEELWSMINSNMDECIKMLRLRLSGLAES